MRSSALVLILLVAACTKKDSSTPATGSASPPSGSAMAGSGSAMAGSDMGSAMAGSAMAGSGSDQAMAGSGSDAGSAAGSAAGEPQSDFDKLTHEEKVDFMKKKVMPPMKAAFQKFDKKEYAKFSCKTCHGKDPQKAKYKMPNPELPKLDFAKLKAGKQAPEMAEFMDKTVKPEMAKILGMPEYSPTQPKGFGCLHCHEQVK
jgi:hypothetical protein